MGPSGGLLNPFIGYNLPPPALPREGVGGDKRSWPPYGGVATPLPLTRAAKLVSMPCMVADSKGSPTPPHRGPGHHAVAVGGACPPAHCGNPMQKTFLDEKIWWRHLLMRKPRDPLMMTGE